MSEHNNDNPITIRMYIAPADAVRAGKPTAGTVEIRLTEQILSQLTDAQRAELATVLSDSRHDLTAEPERYHKAPVVPDRPRITDATTETMSAIIDWRIAYRAAIRAHEATVEAQQREEDAKNVVTAEDKISTVETLLRTDQWGAVCASVERHCRENRGDSRVGLTCEERRAIERFKPTLVARWSAIDDEIRQRLDGAAMAADRARAAAIKDHGEKTQAALRAIVHSMGTESAVERYDRGVLPGCEIESLIAQHVSDAWPTERRIFVVCNTEDSSLEDIVMDHWDGLRPEAKVEHVSDCPRIGGIKRRITEQATWNDTMFRAVKAYETIPGVQVSVLRLMKKCDDCTGDVRRCVVAVSKEWHSYQVTAFYSIEEEES